MANETHFSLYWACHCQWNKVVGYYQHWQESPQKQCQTSDSRWHLYNHHWVAQKIATSCPHTHTHALSTQGAVAPDALSGLLTLKRTALLTAYLLTLPQSTYHETRFCFHTLILDCFSCLLLLETLFLPRFHCVRFSVGHQTMPPCAKRRLCACAPTKPRQQAPPTQQPEC